ncbi:MAG: hypothetical protein HOQ05_08640 [Corynebacteriales bacterium]|nr:hypothetical protein [Mycobacteriales bacterium]
MMARNLVLAERLKALVDSTGHDIRELAAQVGVEWWRIDRLFQGTATLRLGEFSALVHASGLDASAWLEADLNKQAVERVNRADIAGFLFQLRSLAGWSMTQAAAIISRKGSTWRCYENGELLIGARAVHLLDKEIERRRESSPQFAQGLADLFSCDDDVSFYEYFAEKFHHYGFVNRAELEYFRTQTPGAWAALVQRYLGFTPKEMAREMNISARHWTCLVSESGLPSEPWLMRLLEVAIEHRAIVSPEIDEVKAHFDIGPPLTLDDLGVELPQHAVRWKRSSKWHEANIGYLAALRKLTINTSAWDVLHAAILTVNTPLIHEMLRRHGLWEGRENYLEDVASARVAMSRAIDTYQPVVEFSTYAWDVVRNTLWHERIASGRFTVPSPTSRLGVRLRLMRMAMRKHLGAEPSLSQVAHRSSVPKTVVEAFFAGVDIPQQPRLVSLDKDLDGEGRLTLHNSVPDATAPTAFERVDDQQQLRAALASLQVEEREVMLRVYSGEATILELAGGDEREYERLRELHKSGMEKLRQVLQVNQPAASPPHPVQSHSLNKSPGQSSTSKPT